MVVCEDVIKHSLGAGVLAGLRLRLQRGPIRVFFGKALFKLKCREVLVDIGLVVATVASVRTDAFTKQLLNHRDNRLLVGEVDALKSQPCSIEAAVQRACVEGLGQSDPLVFDQMLPKGVYDTSLLLAGCSKLCICPCGSSIAVEFGPVAVPGRSAKVRLGRIVDALAVAAHEEKAVALIALAFPIQHGHVVSKTLPLSKVLAVGEGCIAWIGTLDQAKVASGEVESRGIRRVVVLLEDAGDDGEVDGLGVPVSVDGRGCGQEAVQERRGKHSRRLSLQW